MQITVVGVGQNYDFQSRQMQDELIVRLPNGEMLHIPTQSQICQKVLDSFLANGGSQTQSPEGDEKVSLDWGTPLSEERPKPRERDIVPELQTIFGGISSKQMDRSSVPSKILPQRFVDERGNPILPDAPDYGEEEDDPGEQI